MKGLRFFPDVEKLNAVFCSPNVKAFDVTAFQKQVEVIKRVIDNLTPAHPFDSATKLQFLGAK